MTKITDQQLIKQVYDSRANQKPSDIFKIMKEISDIRIRDHTFRVRLVAGETKKVRCPLKGVLAIKNRGFSLKPSCGLYSEHMAHITDDCVF